MLKLFQRYRELIVVGALLLYPFFRFLAAGQTAREPNFVDRVILWITSPIQLALTWAIDGTGSFWSHYVELRGVKEDNHVLRTDNDKLRAQLQELAELRGQNERLQTLLQFADSRSGQEISASVLGVNPVSLPSTIRINRGEDDGVRKGMPVVTPDGIVGQVIRSTGGYSDVLLVTDPSSRIGVRVQSSRARATATGAGAHKNLRLEHFLRTEPLQEDEVIVTAGSDGIFPAGLRVGRVLGVEKKNVGMFQTAEIVPAVNMVKLEEVLVLPLDLADGGSSAMALPFQGGAQ